MIHPQHSCAVFERIASVLDDMGAARRHFTLGRILVIAGCPPGCAG